MSGRLSLYVAPGIGRIDALALPIRAILGRLRTHEKFEAWTGTVHYGRHGAVSVGVALDGEVNQGREPAAIQRETAARSERSFRPARKLRCGLSFIFPISTSAASIPPSWSRCGGRSTTPHRTSSPSRATSHSGRSARQFAAAREFLDSLQPPKLVVPGNHDVPLWNLARRFLTPFARYKEFISPELEPEYEDEEMIVVGINTARSLAHGEGRINRRQVQRIVKRLAAAPAALIRVIVTHHPFDLPPGVDERRLLGRARMAMAKLAAANADLFLSGHLHISHASHSAERYRIEGHSALIVQAGTVSLRGRGERPSFNLLTVARPDIELVKYVWDPASGGFGRSAVGRYRHTPAGWIDSDW